MTPRLVVVFVALFAAAAGSAVVLDRVVNDVPAERCEPLVLVTDAGPVGMACGVTP
jgi:hypothetical protein